MTSSLNNGGLPSEEDFFPDWSTEAPHSSSLAERINLPSSIVESSNSPISPSSHSLQSYLTNRTPCLLFLYGTLSLPHVLQQVLALPETPILLPATIGGYEVKMWGPYPALLRPQTPQLPPVVTNLTAKVKSKLKRGRSVSSDLKVDTNTNAVEAGEPVVAGMAYWGTEEDVPKLLRHEGENYEIVECRIKSGQDDTLGRTFVWCGYLDDLMEGNFDPTMFPDVDGRTL